MAETVRGGKGEAKGAPVEHDPCKSWRVFRTLDAHPASLALSFTNSPIGLERQFWPFWEWRQEEETKQPERSFPCQTTSVSTPQCQDSDEFDPRNVNLSKRFGATRATFIQESSMFFLYHLWTQENMIRIRYWSPYITLDLLGASCMAGRSERQKSDVSLSHRHTERQTLEDEKAVCPAVFSMSAMSDDDSAAARACRPVRQGPELAIII